MIKWFLDVVKTHQCMSNFRLSWIFTIRFSFIWLSALMYPLFYPAHFMVTIHCQMLQLFIFTLLSQWDLPAWQSLTDTKTDLFFLNCFPTFTSLVYTTSIYVFWFYRDSSPQHDNNDASIWSLTIQLTRFACCPLTKVGDKICKITHVYWFMSSSSIFKVIPWAMNTSSMVVFVRASTSEIVVDHSLF